MERPFQAGVHFLCVAPKLDTTQTDNGERLNTPCDANRQPWRRVSAAGLIHDISQTDSGETLEALPNSQRDREADFDRQGSIGRVCQDDEANRLHLRAILSVRAKRAPIGQYLGGE